MRRRFFVMQRVGALRPIHLHGPAAIRAQLYRNLSLGWHRDLLLVVWADRVAASLLASERRAEPEESCWLNAMIRVRNKTTRRSGPIVGAVTYQ
jgi:hypothetical protein